ncbi:MAG TPA: flagellin [Paenibacillus sp.]|jgi:flagellin
MNIRTNILAINANNNLRLNNDKKERSMEKLSSGLRINGAADDAAGLAISEKMRGQIRGLQQASRNIQDGISLVQIAEGGLANIQSPLQRLRELAIQASNDTLTNDDRQQIQKEIDQIKDGINEIANNTEFNGISLLNISNSNEATIIPGSPYNSGVSASVTFNINGETLTITDPSPSSDSNNIKIDIQTFNSDMFFVSKFSDTLSIRLANLTQSKNNVRGIETVIQGFGTINGVDVSDWIVSGWADGTGPTTGVNEGPKNLTGGIDPTLSTPDIIISSNYSIVNLQIGANSGESFPITLTDARTTALDIDDIDLSTRQGAELALSKIDKALAIVSSERGKFGAYQNRLEHMGNNVLNHGENLTAAESRIRDADMAKEMMALTKAKILVEAGQAMLAQANIFPQNILKLLG